MTPIKHILVAVAAVTLLTACTDELTLADVGQKPGAINVSGYSKNDNLQLVFNGEPLLINGKDSYTGKIETTLRFVVDEDETNTLSIYNTNAEKELANYQINYVNVSEISTLNFYNLPEIFLEASAAKPAVKLGYVGYEFIFPNLGEFSGAETDSIKGVLRKEDGTVLASFTSIGKKIFTEVQSYRAFSNAAPVYLELFKQGSEEPYFGSQILSVKLKQHAGANLIVLQEYRDELGKPVVRGDIDIIDYL
jgi:hypothetical protein